MGEGEIEVREVSSLEELQEVTRLLERIWREERILTTELLRALATHGNPILAAFRGGDMVGTQMGFLGRDGERLILHSHVTGVLPEAQHAGVGFRLKTAQRDWCLVRGIETVTWTFDPMMARNAYFNLRKLGAVAPRFFRDFYGPMEDAYNTGERSDRLEIRWDLTSPRVVAAVEGRPLPVDPSGAVAWLDQEDAAPRPRARAEAERVLIRVPSDYLELRGRHRSLASAWRDAVAEALEDATKRGYAAVDFLREGAYLLERA